MKTIKRSLALALVMVLGMVLWGSGPVFAEEIDVDVNINERAFPDKNFREYVEQFDINGDGVLYQGERDIVTYMDLNEKGIKSLSGIEGFKNLNVLLCSHNQLTELDLSSNICLRKLDCESNQLTKLDLSNNVCLKELDCQKNQLTKLDLSKNPSLLELECRKNNLSSLNVSRCKKLKQIVCFENKIQNLDLSDLYNLNKLQCNDNGMKTLNLEGCSSLEKIYFHVNNLSSLNVQDCKELKILYGLKNQLSQIDLSYNPHLETLKLEGNKLEELDLKNNRSLKELWCGGNNLKSLNLANNTLLEQLKCSSNELTELDLAKNRKLLRFECRGNHLTSLDLSPCPDVTTSSSSITDQTYNIEIDPNTLTLDLTTLPGSFNPERVSNIWRAGIDKEAKTLTVHEGKEATVDYQYRPTGESGLYMGVTLNITYTGEDAYTISFDANGGRGTMDPIPVSKGSSYLVRGYCGFTPKLGHDFDGWEFNGTRYESGSYLTVNDNITLKALWKPAEDVNITFLTYDGTGTMDSVTLKKWASYTLPECGFTPPKGKEFSKWSIASVGYEAGEEIVVFTDEIIKPEWKQAEVTTVDKSELAEAIANARALLASVEASDETDPAKIEKDKMVAPQAAIDAFSQEIELAQAFYDSGEETTQDEVDKKINRLASCEVDLKIKIIIGTKEGSMPDDKPNPGNPEKPKGKEKAVVRLSIGSHSLETDQDGTKTTSTMDVAPYIKDGRTMLPVRYVAQALGFEVDWNEASRTVLLKGDGRQVQIPVDTNKIIVDGVTYESDVQPEIKDGRTFLPLRVIAEALDFEVVWDPATKTVTLKEEDYRAKIPVDTNKITVGGLVYESDVQPEIKDGRTLLPLRALAQALGFEVEWDEATRTVVLKAQGYRAEIPVDSKTFVVNGVTHESDVQPEIKDGRTMLPLRAISQALGFEVQWQETTRTVLLKDKK
ncbi:MAG: stalk domain-containing protein [Tissierellia bacterium]|nr:stalk domain-containing protein [Tissierellia bacterium]